MHVSYLPPRRRWAPPTPPAPKPDPLSAALDKRLEATVAKVRGDAARDAVEFLGAAPSDDGPYKRKRAKA